jgi:hypothetical protein
MTILTESEEMKMQIDTNFKMYTDTRDKKDPDTYSPTLRDYHLHLWSKPLPGGGIFTLTSKGSPPYYLYHSSALGEFCLSSDSIIHTYSRWTKTPIAKIVGSLPKAEIDDFYDLACTVGGYIVFPAKQIERRPTINAIRGMHPQIKDRFDLTLECIRRWYNDEKSPLSAHLDRYGNFFRLFKNFRDYVNFFLLEDLVKPDDSIHFWLSFKDFGIAEPVPTSETEYRKYMENVIEFVKARNKRMSNHQ